MRKSELTNTRFSRTTYGSLRQSTCICSSHHISRSLQCGVIHVFPLIVNSVTKHLTGTLITYSTLGQSSCLVIVTTPQDLCSVDVIHVPPLVNDSLNKLVDHRYKWTGHFNILCGISSYFHADGLKGSRLTTCLQFSRKYTRMCFALLTFLVLIFDFCQEWEGLSVVTGHVGRTARYVIIRCFHSTCYFIECQRLFSSDITFHMTIGKRNVATSKIS